MSDYSSNRDGPRVASVPPDAHGMAAMLLVESLIHALIARSVITVQDAVELVDDAADVSRLMTEESTDGSGSSDRSVTLLMAISKSLRADLPKS